MLCPLNVQAIPWYRGSAECDTVHVEADTGRKADAGWRTSSETLHLSSLHMRKAIMHAPTRAVAVLIRVQFQDPFPHRRESMALEDPKRNYTSSNDKIVQGVCTAFCYDTDR